MRYPDLRESGAAMPKSLKDKEVLNKTVGDVGAASGFFA